MNRIVTNSLRFLDQLLLKVSVNVINHHYLIHLDTKKDDNLRKRYESGSQYLLSTSSTSTAKQIIGNISQFNSRDNSPNLTPSKSSNQLKTPIKIHKLIKLAQSTSSPG